MTDIYPILRQNFPLNSVYTRSGFIYLHRLDSTRRQNHVWVPLWSKSKSSPCVVSCAANCLTQVQLVFTQSSPQGGMWHKFGFYIGDSEPVCSLKIPLRLRMDGVGFVYLHRRDSTRLDSSLLEGRECPEPGRKLIRCGCN